MIVLIRHTVIAGGCPHYECDTSKVIILNGYENSALCIKRGEKYVKSHKDEKYAPVYICENLNSKELLKMIKCPRCESSVFKKNGLTLKGAQRFRCINCGKYYQKNYIKRRRASMLSLFIISMFQEFPNH